MTPEQLQKINLLKKKIAHNEEILKDLRNSNSTIEEQQRTSTLVTLAYHSTDATACDIVIDPEWFHSPELRADFHYCAKVAKDGFMELLEKDLSSMKEELGKL